MSKVEHFQLSGTNGLQLYFACVWVEQFARIGRTEWMYLSSTHSILGTCRFIWGETPSGQQEQEKLLNFLFLNTCLIQTAIKKKNSRQFFQIPKSILLCLSSLSKKLIKLVEKWQAMSQMTSQHSGLASQWCGYFFDVGHKAGHVVGSQTLLGDKNLQLSP